MSLFDRFKSAPVTVYLSSVLRYEIPQDFIKSTMSANQFYEDLSGHQSLKCLVEASEAIDDIVRQAGHERFPGYLYKIELENTEGFFSGESKLSMRMRIQANKFIDAEVSDELTKEYLKAEAKERNIERFATDIGGSLGMEWADRLFKEIGLGGYYSDYYVSILDLSLIKGFEREQVYSPISTNRERHVEETWAEDALFSIGNESIFQAHALRFDPDYQDYAFKRIKDCNPDYKRKTFNALIKKANKQEPVRREKKKKPIDFPPTLEDLEKLAKGTEEHFSKELIQEIRTAGVTNSTTLKIREEDGQKFVTKELGNQDITRSEHEAYKIYEALGVKVPQCSLIQENDRTILVMECIEGSLLERSVQRSKDKVNLERLHTLRQEIAKDFAIDALLCNPDVGCCHLRNIIHSKDDNALYRIDMGYALSYHAEGRKKHVGSNSEEWGVHVLDFDDYRRYGRASYNSVTNTEVRDRLKRASQNLDKVKAVASEETYGIISGRLEKALMHFDKRCRLEKERQEKALDSTVKKIKKKIRIKLKLQQKPSL